MTNPGHMDPGYHGTMRFTVINMGQEAHPLSQGKEIVTVLFFRLERPAEKDWSARGGIRSSGVSGNTLSKLSRDFVDVDRRAADIAGKRARRVIARYGLMAILLTLLTVIAAFTIAFLPIYFTTVNKTNDLQNDIRQLKDRVGIDGASSSGSPAAPTSSTSTQLRTPSPPSTSSP
jgi:hypothetical protein